MSSTLPNIVFVLADNLGWGELGCYGGGVLRGAPTPRIDALAAEGLRLTNFNVESDCVPTRSALMTGRHSIRTGALQSVPAGLPQGITPWEITLAQLLSAQGYATAIYGKWHLGNRAGRYPTDRGFDEWYGIPRTTNESMFTSTPGFDSAVVPMPYVMEARRGEPAKNIAIYDLELRRKIDAQLIARSIDFMQRQVKANKPFFAYVPLTQLHYPTLPHHDFAGKSGAGDFADAMVEMDARVGQLIDFIDNSVQGRIARGEVARLENAPGVGDRTQHRPAASGNAVAVQPDARPKRRNRRRHAAQLGAPSAACADTGIPAKP